MGIQVGEDDKYADYDETVEDVHVGFKDISEKKNKKNKKKNLDETKQEKKGRHYDQSRSNPPRVAARGELIDLYY